MCDLVALYRTVQYGYSTFTVNCGKDFGSDLLLPLCNTPATILKYDNFLSFSRNSDPALRRRFLMIEKA